MHNNKETIDIFENRRYRIREKIADGNLDAVLITSRQNSRYAAGFTGSTSAILCTADNWEIFVDSRYTEQAKEQCGGFDVHEVASIFKAAVDSMKEKGVKRLGLEEKDLSWAVLKQLETLSGDKGIEFCPADSVFTQLRVRKDDLELSNIREAVRVADQAWELTLPEIKAGVSEVYVAAVLEHNMRLLGAEGPSFDTIIASGYRSAMPHGVASEKIIEDGDTIVMDFGALVNGYCSDITRTVFLGRVDPKMKEVYEVVLAAQENCEAHLKAGLTGAEGDRLARSIIEYAGYGDQFTHSTGHSLGLDIHEMPGLSRLYDKALPANCLMTIEPGIYLAGTGGVRIEDLVIIQDDGIEILTHADKSIRVL